MLHHGKNWISGTNRIIAYLSKTACVTKRLLLQNVPGAEGGLKQRWDIGLTERNALFCLFLIQQGYNANEHLSTEEIAKSVAYGSLVDESLTDALVGSSQIGNMCARHRDDIGEGTTKVLTRFFLFFLVIAFLLVRCCGKLFGRDLQSVFEPLLVPLPLFLAYPDP